MPTLRNILCMASLLFCLGASAQTIVPQVDGDFWQIASDPDLGAYTTPNQQPVDFGIWQAANGAWQLWSCIRYTKVPGKTRLFFRWQADHLTDKNWKPMGIALMTDPNFGEVEGGTQAPFVYKEGSVFYMVYGTWEHIALATSQDGKTFARQLGPDGKSGMFTEGPGGNTRDPMLLKIGDTYHLYYMASLNDRGVIYVRTSQDLHHWSDSTKVNYGGSMGGWGGSAECPFVFFHKESGFYYLLRNHRYGPHAQFSVYRAQDPHDFGRGNDDHLVESLPYAAPEIIESEGQTYLATLLPTLKGIQIAKLKWTPKP